MKRARIDWASLPNRREKWPPKGPRYITVSRFLADEGLWPDEAWSLVVLLENPEGLTSCEADVEFLMPAGPRHLLEKGAQFELLEGTQVTARGEIL